MDMDSYLKKNGYIEFDKEEIKKEFIKPNQSKQMQEAVNETIDRSKYYRIMADGTKIFYSEKYIETHSIEELESGFLRLNSEVIQP